MQYNVLDDCVVRFMAKPRGKTRHQILTLCVLLRYGDGWSQTMDDVADESEARDPIEAVRLSGIPLRETEHERRPLDGDCDRCGGII